MIDTPSSSQVKEYIKSIFPYPNMSWWRKAFGLYDTEYYSFAETGKPIRKLEMEFRCSIILMIFMKREYLQRDIFWVRTRGSCGLFSYDGNNLRYLSADIGNIAIAFKQEGRSIIEMNILDICRILIEAVLDSRRYNHWLILGFDHLCDFYFMNIRTHMYKYDTNYHLAVQVESKVNPPKLLEVGNGWVLQFVTVCGNAQYYDNLGLETFFISHKFDIYRRDRVTLCENIFTRLPYRIS